MTGRLLLVSTTSKVGGTERVVMALARGLSQLNLDVTTVLAEDVDAPETSKWFSRNGVHASISPAVLTVYSKHTTRSLLALRALARRSQPDVVNIHYGGNRISWFDVAAIRAAGIRRCVASVHHPLPINNARAQLATLASSKLVSSVVVTTEVAANLLVKAGVSRRKLRVIPPCVEPPAVRPQRQEARRRLGLAQDAFVIGCLARLTPEKGIAELIHAVATMADLPFVRLLIAGDGPARPELERLAAEMLPGRTHFTGRVPETSDVYAASNLFALPSHMEGFGLVYVEAALHGVPSVGTNVGGVPVAIEDGVTGSLVPARDVPALAGALRSLCQAPDRLTRMGRAARKRALSNFSPQAMCEGYRRVLFED